MPRRTSWVALLLATALAVGACSTTTPTPTPAPTPAPTAAPPTATPAPTGTPRPPAEVFGEIRTQVEAIRGLEPTADVDPVTIDAAQLATNLEAEFDATYDEKTLKDVDDLLQTLGLMPAGTSLRDATLAFQAGQVAGYYSPDKDELFVVNRTGAIGPVDEATYAHEFTHQLQDQHVDLGKLGIATVDQSDRALARLALVEGDATSVQTTWMVQNLSSKEMGELLAASLDPAALAALNNAPQYLRDTALFPYQQGAAFVMRLTTTGGYAAVDAAFANPPDSTEQVLHPEKYDDREKPATVMIPDDLEQRLGAGWSEVGQDTLGELVIRTWLSINGQFEAAKAAAGWGGDRLALYRGPKGETLVLLITAWDTADDATEFGTIATAALGVIGRPSATRVGGTRVFIAIGDAGAVEALRLADGLIAG